jgi:4a-hydroxytetrahydrobiopterin dehydratase
MSRRSLLTDAQLAAGLQRLPGGRRQGDAIHRSLTLADFAAAMAFVNSVAGLAEAEDHHPDIRISWNRVELELSTHSAGGITQRDLDLAAGIDALLSD